LSSAGAGVAWAGGAGSGAACANSAPLLSNMVEPSSALLERRINEVQSRCMVFPPEFARRLRATGHAVNG
jgi:hypothetical protein